MGLINQESFQLFKESEDSVLQALKDNELRLAYILWQRELKHIQDILGISNLYDVTQEVPDITDRNFWHFIQKAEVRRAIHVGNRPFSDGEMVINLIFMN